MYAEVVSLPRLSALHSHHWKIVASLAFILVQRFFMGVENEIGLLSVYPLAIHPPIRMIFTVPWEPGIVKCWCQAVF